MPQTIHTGIKALIDEANAEIETLSAADAMKAAQGNDVIIVDIRDPREIERDGRIPGAFSCTRGMLEFWIDPGQPLRQAGVPGRQEIHLPLRRRHALGAGGQDRAGHGVEAGRAYGRRLRGLARRRRSGGKVRAEEEELATCSVIPGRAQREPRDVHRTSGIDALLDSGSRLVRSAAKAANGDGNQRRINASMT